MAKINWSTVIDHTSDAGFRAWGSEFSGQMAVVGLVKTADTGQINWATVVRSGTGTNAGYEIWRFADSTFFLKIFYGTGAAGSTTPRMQVQVGTGSDGAGALTGQTSTLTTFVRGNTPASTATGYPSYMCATADFFGVLWKANYVPVGNPGTGFGFFAIDKFVDSTGTATSDGATIYYVAASNSVGTLVSYEAIKTSSPSLTYGVNTAFCVVPSLITSSAVGANNQLFLHFAPTTPLVRPVKNVFSILNSELALSTTITATPVGSTSHTYISLNSQAGRGNSVSAGHDVGIAMLWE